MVTAHMEDVSIVHFKVTDSVLQATCLLEDRWGYSVSNARYRCFSGDSLVVLSNGTYKQIGHLQPGDEIITSDQRKVISTEMIMMLDKRPSKKGID
jgi:hypothetical protein